MRSVLPFGLWVSSAVLFTGCAATPPGDGRDSEPHIRALLRQTPLIDGHNDVPWGVRARFANHLDRFDFAGDTASLDRPMHTDLPRMRAGGVGAQFWSVYIPIAEAPGRPGDARTVIEQIDVARRLIDRYDDLELALTSADVRRIHRDGRIASLIGMEGGHSIENSLAVLRATYDLGARYMTLTHSRNLAWADSATDDRALGGLSPFGEEVVREMNRLGMLVDLSHVSPDVMRHALRITEAPVIFSHSSARALCDHPRNVPDDVLAMLPDNGGVVMVTFVPPFVSEELRVWLNDQQAERERLEAQHPDDAEAVDAGLAAWAEARPRPVARLDQVADHIDHIRRVAGIEHIGIGSDFDGIGAGPLGLEDVSTFPALFAELARRGYSDADLRAIAGENVLRVMAQVERVAARLQRQRGPSEALIEDLDGADPLRPAPSADD
ncbi:MAG: membrane dipeptidase [Planctomycetota bacterium]|nr:MAG: membrane dipeptidase [Planctomycetota bacterium]